MIKINQINVRNSSKRLFSEICLHNVIPINFNSSECSTTTDCMSKYPKNHHEKNNFEIKKTEINALNGGANVNESNFVKSIVSSKITYSKSNLITMVIDESHTSVNCSKSVVYNKNSNKEFNFLKSNFDNTLGSKFNEKLKNIENEKANY